MAATAVAVHSAISNVNHGHDGTGSAHAGFSLSELDPLYRTADEAGPDTIAMLEIHVVEDVQSVVGSEAMTMLLNGLRCHPARCFPKS
ncbi:hypothetical protein [Microvirga aerophila]|uniref:hypothetical protein n=1 Tax=Microvirga aerophila TaxID=670291 RepID=UPI0011BF1629|nr:hypothetical protein [Microvirga aerophila]